MSEYLPVDATELESALDDAAQAPATEGEVLVAVPEQTEGAEAQSAPQIQKAPEHEPGWIKARVDAAVRKQLAQAASDIEARVRQQMEAQYAPLRESLIEREADDLVASGKVTDKQMALDFVRMKRGNPTTTPAPAAPAQQMQQPRDAQGRFVSPAAPAVDADTMSRANALAEQAKTIQAMGGPDVVTAWRNNAEVKRRVNTGEWDFTDVARYLSGEARRQETPGLVRSANGSGRPVSTILSMSDEEFKRLDAEISHGKVYKTRR